MDATARVFFIGKARDVFRMAGVSKESANYEAFRKDFQRAVKTFPDHKTQGNSSKLTHTLDCLSLGHFLRDHDVDVDNVKAVLEELEQTEDVIAAICEGLKPELDSNTRDLPFDVEDGVNDTSHSADTDTFADTAMETSTNDTSHSSTASALELSVNDTSHSITNGDSNDLSDASPNIAANDTSHSQDNMPELTMNDTSHSDTSTDTDNASVNDTSHSSLPMTSTDATNDTSHSYLPVVLPATTNDTSHSIDHDALADTIDNANDTSHSDMPDNNELATNDTSHSDNDVDSMPVDVTVNDTSHSDTTGTNESDVNDTSRSKPKQQYKPRHERKHRNFTVQRELTRNFGITVTPSLLEAFKDVVAREGTTASAVLCQAMREYIALHGQD